MNEHYGWISFIKSWCLMFTSITISKHKNEWHMKAHHCCDPWTTPLFPSNVFSKKNWCFPKVETNGYNGIAIGHKHSTMISSLVASFFSGGGVAIVTFVV